MKHKYRRNYPAYLYKHEFDVAKYYRIGSRKYEILSSGYYENQAYVALHKCRVGYVISLNKGEFDNEIKYASRIQNLQKELCLEVSDFKYLEGLGKEYMKFYKT